MAAPDSFDRALALSTAEEGRFSAHITEGWDVRGNPHGGYLLALVARAMGHVVAQPDPLSVSASYLAPPQFGPAQLSVAVLRAGTRQSTATVDLSQDGVTRVHAVATFGNLSDDAPDLHADDAARPALVGPELCAGTEALDEAEGGPIALHERLELRLDPATGWLEGAPSGRAELNGWLRHSGGRAPDPWALLMFSDGMPPSLFEKLGRQGIHVPTVQLTTHLFAKPADGWVQGRFRTRVTAAGFVDEDGELWDSTGKLVATTRQLALLRTWAS